MKPLPDDASILVIQTAFPGDVVLTLPLVQSLKRAFPAVPIDFIATPPGSELLSHHPAIRGILEYDKHGNDSGLKGFARMVHLIGSRRYSLAFVPHRSIRSALLAMLARIPERIGFDRSTGRRLFTTVVRYNPALHETERNLSLLDTYVPGELRDRLPVLYPVEEDRRFVDDLLHLNGVATDAEMIGIAPGSVWPTKRWPEQYFSDLIRTFEIDRYTFVLIGGKGDQELCERIRRSTGLTSVSTAAGKCTFLQSAELIRRCRFLVSNDSAPMHIATAMRTPVIALFGPTVPAFGFGPLGDKSAVVGVENLSCRPCSIHGGNKCPIRTFDCMKKLYPDMVVEKIKMMLG